MKTTARTIGHPETVPITPRLLAAIEAASGKRFPKGAVVMVMPPPPPPPAPKSHPPKHPGQTCHLCGAAHYACEHIPGVPF